MKKIIFAFCIMLIGLLSLVSCGNEKVYEIVATNFAGYDASMSVLYGNNRNSSYDKVKMLIKPNSDIHSYQPSATDKRAIAKSKLFIYVGGESDSEWVSDLLVGNKNSFKIINMFEVLKDKLILEEGEEDEYDEHVWLDPSNYKMIINAIKDEMIKIDSDNKDKYIKNTEAVISSIDTMDNNMKQIIKENNITDILVADRNPFAYFGKYYGINVTGALKGCSSDKSVPLMKIVELKNLVEEKRFFSIYKIELSDGAIAKSIYDEVLNDIDNKKYNTVAPTIRILYSMQNISLEDFNKGMTYVDYMQHNSEVISKVYKLDIAGYIS